MTAEGSIVHSMQSIRSIVTHVRPHIKLLQGLPIELQSLCSLPVHAYRNRIVIRRRTCAVAKLVPAKSVTEPPVVRSGSHAARGKYAEPVAIAEPFCPKTDG